MPAVSKKQQKFFGIVRAIQKGEMAPTTPETAKAAADMKKGDVKKFASTKHKGLPEKKKIEEDRQIKKIIKQLRKSVKAHDKQADTLEKKIEEESNPRIPRKKGQPANSKKHSDLYTDENPKGTIHGLGFKNVAKAKASVSKIRNSSRSHAHKIQAAVALEQRAREMGKTSEAAVYRKYINSMKKKTKKMNEGWSDKYKKSIDCNNPKGFSQKAHCQGKKKKLKDITEGMTTSNAYTVILPPRGNTNLQDIPYSLKGTGEINYGSLLGNTEEDPNTLVNPDDEYTALTNMAGMFDAPDPRGVGQQPRSFDIETQTFSGHTNIGSSDAFNSRAHRIYVR